MIGLIKLYLDHKSQFPDLLPMDFEIDKLRRLRNKSAHGEMLSEAETVAGLHACECVMDVVVTVQFWPIYNQIVALNKYFIIKWSNLIQQSWNEQSMIHQTSWPQILPAEEILMQCQP